MIRKRRRRRRRKRRRGRRRRRRRTIRIIIWNKQCITTRETYPWFFILFYFKCQYLHTLRAEVCKHCAPAFDFAFFKSMWRFAPCRWLDHSVLYITRFIATRPQMSPNAASISRRRWRIVKWVNIIHCFVSPEFLLIGNILLLEF